MPRSFLLCEDEGVIGTAFYLMGYVEGRVFDMPHMPDSSPHQRTACHQAMISTMAALHNVDWAAAGWKGQEVHLLPFPFCACRRNYCASSRTMLRAMTICWICVVPS